MGHFLKKFNFKILTRNGLYDPKTPSTGRISTAILDEDTPQALQQLLFDYMYANISIP